MRTASRVDSAWLAAQIPGSPCLDKVRLSAANPPRLAVFLERAWLVLAPGDVGRFAARKTRGVAPIQQAASPQEGEIAMCHLVA